MRDQLDVTSFIISLFNAQKVSDVNTSILRACHLFVELFHGSQAPEDGCINIRNFTFTMGVKTVYYPALLFSGGIGSVRGIDRNEWLLK